MVNFMLGEFYLNKKLPKKNYIEREINLDGT